MPQEDLIRGAKADVPQLFEDIESDTRNVILTLARIWTTASERADPLEERGGGFGRSSTFARATAQSSSEPATFTCTLRMRNAGPTSRPSGPR